MAEDSLCSRIVCPSCHGSLAWRQHEAVCESESIAYPISDGIPHLVVPSSRARVAAFLERYLAVRHDERWTDDDRALLLALPFADATGRRAWMWRVRARGLRALRRMLRRRYGQRRLRVCERGAGVAWLAYRLTLDGHAVASTDINTDARDGLGAARHYLDAGARFVRLAAEMDRVPLADGAVDVVVNAASLHYAPDQRAAIREATRLLAPGGVFVVLDSPLYSTRGAGEAMVAEWGERLATRYGSGVGQARDSGYLVRDELLEMLSAAGLTPSFEEHWMGWHWTANYWRGRLGGGREPARLPMIIGQRD
jgi:SAM-dependent methyltransferase